VTALAALCGAGVGFGAVLVALSVAGRPPRLPSGRLPRPGGERLVPRLAGAVGAAVVMGAATSWPVGALLAGAAGFALPGLLGGKAGREAAVARTEAIAGWTEMLRDTMAAAARAGGCGAEIAPLVEGA
jgi:tight adherence protein B